MLNHTTGKTNGQSHKKSGHSQKGGQNQKGTAGRSEKGQDLASGSDKEQGPKPGGRGGQGGSAEAKSAADTGEGKGFAEKAMTKSTIAPLDIVGIASGVTGIALAGVGFARRGPVFMALAGTGIVLTIGAGIAVWLSARAKARKCEQEAWNSRDCVDVASEDSFPASDPPAWTTGREHGEPVG